MQPNKPARPEPAPNLVLAMLLVVYTFNYLDRQILSVVAQQVKADLGISDAQVGALGGIAFALLYTTMGVPLGLLADRKGRTRVIAAGLVVWSGFTALCGAATNFAQLFACRLGVGIGEAGGVAPSYALIADYFPPERRSRALALYSLGVPFGSAAGALFGASIAAAINWRAAFVILGVAGVIAAIPFALLVRDRALPSAAATQPPFAALGKLVRLPAFWLISLGTAAGGIGGTGLLFWTPALLQRSYGLTLVQAGQSVGALLLLASATGMVIGGVLGDRAGQRDRAGYARLPAWAFLLCAPGFALAFTSTGPTALFLLLIAPFALAFVWNGPIITAIQHIVAPAERAGASACFLLVVNLIAFGLGPYLIGALSDRLAPASGPEALRHAMAAVAGLAFTVSAACLYLSGPRLRAAWQD